MIWIGSQSHNKDRGWVDFWGWIWRTKGGGGEREKRMEGEGWVGGGLGI